MNVVFGDSYQDRLTGFVGVAVARTLYLHGHAQVLLQRLSEDRGSIDEWWFDETRLEELGSPEAPGQYA